MTERPPAHERDAATAPARTPGRDPTLIVLCALLATTLGAFAAGWIHYPVGVLVLVALVVARATGLRRRR